jgi:Asp-tRNA(Asn)/Glu-tRNA(Gln) amidotransferase A subunit family amidase
VLRTSRNLDHVGLFARTVEDAALMAEAMIGFDAQDGDTLLRPRPNLAARCREEPPMAPLFAFFKGPAWDQCDTATQEAFAELVDALGDRVRTVEIDSVYEEVFAWQRIVMEADIARNLGEFYDRAGDNMSDLLKGMIERGRQVRAVDYAIGMERMQLFNESFGEMTAAFDAIITPAATGEAPVGLGSTGSPACSTLWSFTGMPALSLPLLQGEAGMPLGVQLVTRRHDDARLFRNASWLVKYLEGMASEV